MIIPAVSGILAGASSSVPPTFVARGTPDSAINNISSWTPVDWPAGLVTGDLVIACIYATSGVGLQNPVAGGWSTLVNTASGAVYVRWHRYTSGDSLPTFTLASGTGPTFGCLWAYRGCVASGNPYEGELDDSASSVSSHNAPTFSPAGDAEIIVNMVVGTATNHLSGTPGSGETGRGAFIDITDGSGVFGGMGLYDIAGSTGVPQGGATISCGPGATILIGVSFGLLPL